jgi:hypothetical protein
MHSFSCESTSCLDNDTVGKYMFQVCRTKPSVKLPTKNRAKCFGFLGKFKRGFGQSMMLSLGKLFLPAFSDHKAIDKKKSFFDPFPPSPLDFIGRW